MVIQINKKNEAVVVTPHGLSLHSSFPSSTLKHEHMQHKELSDLAEFEERL